MRVARKGHESPDSYRGLTYRAEYIEMERPSMRKPYTYQLNPTPEQEQALEPVLGRALSHALQCRLEERKTAWGRYHVCVTSYQQKAESPDRKAACPQYAEGNAHVLQDVVLRVARAVQAFLRRLKAGEEPGYPRLQAHKRYHRFTYPQDGGSAALDGGVLSLPTIGRIRARIRLHRPLDGTPKTVTSSHEADGWYACLWCADVPVQPLPLTGQQTGIDVGLKVFLISPPRVRWWTTLAITAPPKRRGPKPTAG